MRISCWVCSLVEALAKKKFKMPIFGPPSATTPTPELSTANPALSTFASAMMLEKSYLTITTSNALRRLIPYTRLVIMLGGTKDSTRYHSSSIHEQDNLHGR